MRHKMKGSVSVLPSHPLLLIRIGQPLIRPPHMAMQLLVIAPHPDDESIGCGGTIIRRVDEGWTVHVAVVSAFGVVSPSGEVKCTLEQRLEEFQNACAELGVHSTEMIFTEAWMPTGEIPMRELVTRLDRILQQCPYQEVLFPGLSYHDHHRTVREATWSALRARPNRRLELRALAYEMPYGDWHPEREQGAPWYVDITGYLEKKIAAVAHYRTQLQPAPFPLSLNALERLAAKRGTECGVPLAERHALVRGMEPISRR